MDSTRNLPLDKLIKNIMLDIARGGEVQSACRSKYDQLLAAGLSDEVATAVIETILVSYINFSRGVTLIGFGTEKDLVAAYKKTVNGDVTAEDVRSLKLSYFPVHIAAEYGVKLSHRSVWIRNFGYVKEVQNEQ